MKTSLDLRSDCHVLPRTLLNQKDQKALQIYFHQIKKRFWLFVWRRTTFRLLQHHDMSDLFKGNHKTQKCMTFKVKCKYFQFEEYFSPDRDDLETFFGSKKKYPYPALLFD